MADSVEQWEQANAHGLQGVGLGLVNVLFVGDIEWMVVDTRQEHESLTKQNDNVRMFNVTKGF